MGWASVQDCAFPSRLVLVALQPDIEAVQRVFLVVLAQLRLPPPLVVGKPDEGHVLGSVCSRVRLPKMDQLLLRILVAGQRIASKGNKL